MRGCWLESTTGRPLKSPFFEQGHDLLLVVFTTAKNSTPQHELHLEYEKLGLGAKHGTGRAPYIAWGPPAAALMPPGCSGLSWSRIARMKPGVLVIKPIPLAEKVLPLPADRQGAHAVGRAAALAKAQHWAGAAPVGQAPRFSPANSCWRNERPRVSRSLVRMLPRRCGRPRKSRRRTGRRCLQDHGLAANLAVGAGGLLQAQPGGQGVLEVQDNTRPMSWAAHSSNTSHRKRPHWGPGAR